MLYIILALLFYTAAIMFGALASRNANTNVVAAIINSISALIPIAVILPMVNKGIITSQKFGLIMAVVGGVAVAFFTMALNKSYQINKVAIVAPIVFGGAIFLSAILSYILFKEKISGIQSIGLFFLAIGLAFIVYSAATSK